ncbi:MAG: ABC transporter substrate-binding protein [Oscillospiraceae bacterium]|nr:ABC transporter substrate-binding protein [Oscillospiraceae bacterium]
MKKFLSIILAFALAFSFAGCNALDKIFDMSFGEDEQPTQPPIDTPEILEPIDPNWPVSVFGTEIEKSPEKVAAASPALAEYISDMGLFERLCAVPDYCGFEGAFTLPSIGSAALPDMEAIRAAAPEYILTFSQFEESLLIELQQMNITVIVIEAPQSLDDLRELYRSIALFFNGAVDGIPFGEDYVAEYDSAIATMAYSGEMKSAAFIRALDYMMITGDTMLQEFISAAGIRNAAESFSGYTFPEESWKEFDPEVLFLNPDLHLIDLETSDLYKKKTAVKGDKVFNVDIDALGICSRRSIHLMKDVLATVYEDYSSGTPFEPAYPSMYQK